MYKPVRFSVKSFLVGVALLAGTFGSLEPDSGLALAGIGRR
jgi:hypothetical protein